MECAGNRQRSLRLHIANYSGSAFPFLDLAQVAFHDVDVGIGRLHERQTQQKPWLAPRNGAEYGDDGWDRSIHHNPADRFGHGRPAGRTLTSRHAACRTPDDAACSPSDGRRSFDDEVVDGAR